MFSAISRLVGVPGFLYKKMTLGQKVIVSVASDGKSPNERMKKLEGLEWVEVSPILFRVKTTPSDETSGVFYRILVIKGKLLCSMVGGVKKFDKTELHIASRRMNLLPLNTEAAFLFCERFANRGCDLPDEVTVVVNPLKIDVTYPDFFIELSRESGKARIDPLIIDSALSWDHSTYFAFITPYSPSECVSVNAQMVHERPAVAKV